MPSVKTTDVIYTRVSNPADMSNMAFMGTAVSRGNGRGVVVCTATNTEIGKISAELYASVRDIRTPTQVKLAQFGIQLAVLAVALCALVVVIAYLRHYELLKMSMIGVALAVSVIPEGLVAVVTVCLALGVQRMAKKSAVVRHIASVETLGSITVICTDKTGTLTEGIMRVEEVYTSCCSVICNADGKCSVVSGRSVNDRIGELFDSAFASRSSRTNDPIALLPCCTLICLSAENSVDPTEMALSKLLNTVHFDTVAVSRTFEKTTELAFDPNLKLMATAHVSLDKDHLEFGQYFIVIKGAPESIIQRCSGTYEQAEHVDRAKLLDIAGDMAGRGLRVLSFAYISTNSRVDIINIDDLDEHLVFVGFVGMRDPERSTALPCVSSCLSASIAVIMITGDHNRTAAAIARTVGILPPIDVTATTRTRRRLDITPMVLHGNDADAMSTNELASMMPFPRVIARASPSTKLKVVRALHARGEIVAMIGMYMCK